MPQLFWISQDGERWGRAAQDRHGNLRQPLPDGALEVDEVGWRRHVANVRAERDRDARSREDDWQANPPEPRAVLRPAHGHRRLMQIAAADLALARTRAVEVANLAEQFETGDGVRVESGIESDGESWAEVTHRLVVAQVPAALSARTAEVLAGIQRALDHAHAAARSVAVATSSVDKDPAAPPAGFPVPRAWVDPFAETEWARALTAGDERLVGLLQRCFVGASADTWHTHPARVLSALREHLLDRPAVDVAAGADVVGDGQTRVNGMSVGFDVSLPDPGSGVSASKRYELLPADRPTHLEQLEREIARCESLPDDDVSFALYTKDEELAELRREHDSWSGPWTVTRNVRSRARLVLPLPPHDRVEAGLERLLTFGDHCLAEHEAFCRSPG